MLIIDDFLLEPEKILAWADDQRAMFAVEGGNYFPGPEVTMPDPFTAQLGDFFTLHVRRLLGARRTLEASSRLSMVTKAPAALQPLQRICHSDTMVGPRSVNPAANEGIAASVLYLFADAALGGTSFYAPRKAPAEMAALNRHAMQCTTSQFDQVIGAPAAYLTASNDYFEQVASVPAAFNRIIFYDGAILHSGQIDAPGRLSPDPRKGRLTLNGFFLLRKLAS